MKIHLFDDYITIFQDLLEKHFLNMKHTAMLFLLSQTHLMIENVFKVSNSRPYNTSCSQPTQVIGENTGFNTTMHLISSPAN